MNTRLAVRAEPVDEIADWIEAFDQGGQGNELHRWDGVIERLHRIAIGPETFVSLSFHTAPAADAQRCRSNRPEKAEWQQHARVTVSKSLEGRKHAPRIHMACKADAEVPS
jgi:hypothetical protein